MHRCRNLPRFCRQQALGGLTLGIEAYSSGFSLRVFQPNARCSSDFVEPEFLLVVWVSESDVEGTCLFSENVGASRVSASSKLEDDPNNESSDDSVRFEVSTEASLDFCTWHKILEGGLITCARSVAGNNRGRCSNAVGIFKPLYILIVN